MKTIKDSCFPGKIINDNGTTNSPKPFIEGCTCPKPLLSPNHICSACMKYFHGVEYDVSKDECGPIVQLNEFNWNGD